MKLATLRDGRDGTLVVVRSDLSRFAYAHAGGTLQRVLDDWANSAPVLAGQAADLRFTHPFDPAACASPLPRAFQWADGSAYVNHVELVRRARGAALPDSFWTDPLMYQGGSDAFLGPREDIPLADPAWGCDFEGEVAVILGDVPMGVPADEALQFVRLVMLVNDVSLRNLIPGELAKGFGFFQSKPSSAFSPVAVTPDELGPAWQHGRLHLPLLCHVNGTLFGKPNAGADMTFDFGQLIAHAARTRRLAAGTIIGSGTVSNRQGSLHGSSVANGGVGYACIAELRMYEQIEHGAPKTPFLQHGDTVRIEMLDSDGASIFGAIEQKVVPA
jgi:fumarylacetoacetate (FAA) hydrolase